MPMKDATTDNAATFAMGRKEYVKTVLTTTTTTNAQKNHKKWTSNRDASQVAMNRRIKAIGTGTLNAANIPISFMNDNERNLINREKIHCRSGGANVPKKVTNSKHFTANVCISVKV
jgi:hypothetical protein